MKTITIRRPIDIFLCLGFNIILLPIVFTSVNGVFRIVFGIPLILFIPGYLLLLCLFPYKSYTSKLDPILRFGLSIGLSISLVSLDGILLFYSPFGFNELSIFTSLFVISLLFGIVALYQWQKSPIKKQYSFSLNTPKFESKSKFDKILKMLLILSITLTIITIGYISFLPNKQEAFTEFYILGSTGKVIHYPRNLTVGQDSNVTIGLINHEHKTMDYSIEIWLVNQTLHYNTTTNTNETIYHEMWFLDRLTVNLKHFEKNTEILWQPQWEYFYNFSINRTGRYTLMFLLFTTPAPDYNTFQNYYYMAATEIQSAYQSLYIWINIQE